MKTCCNDQATATDAGPARATAAVSETASARSTSLRQRTLLYKLVALALLSSGRGGMRDRSGEVQDLVFQG
jgi:hypothetical protein